jgi:hypothetical protein
LEEKVDEAKSKPAAADSDVEQNAQLQLFRSHGDGAWTVLKDSENRDGVSFGIYCALGNPARRSPSLAEPSWNLNVTSGEGPQRGQNRAGSLEF